MNKEERIQIALGLKFLCIKCKKVKDNKRVWATEFISLRDGTICMKCVSKEWLGE